jgi:IclR family transcriptional regulator, acetate operon repressor
VNVPDAPARLALSVSGPATRVTEEFVQRAVPLLTKAGKALSDDLA